MFLYLCTNFGLVAQWIEQQPSKLRVIGSNPIEVTFQNNNRLLNKCLQAVFYFYILTYIQF